MNCYREIFVVVAFAVGLVLSQHAVAETPISNLERIETLARQLQATQAELRQTQAEIKQLRQRGDDEKSGTKCHSVALASGMELNCDVGICDAACDGCPNCGATSCQGLPHLCSGCKEQLSWTKGSFRIVPYGAVMGEGISSDRTIVLRGSPLYLAPGPAPGIDDSRFTISGQQTIVGVASRLETRHSKNVCWRSIAPPLRERFGNHP